jgi:GAF domain-containing protein
VEDYMDNYLIKSLDSLLENTNDNIAVLANASAFINEFIGDVNWVGFYLLKNDALVLGPFQGRSACVDIQIGKGVCGRCALVRKSIIIKDVKQIDNYISCHDETRSEIVLPIIINDNLYGVLDIDSLTVDRFSEDDLIILEEFVEIIKKYIEI